MNKGKSVVVIGMIAGIVAISGATLAQRHLTTQHTESQTTGSGIANYTASVEADLDDMEAKELFVSTEKGAGNLQFEVFHIETREARHNVLRLVHIGPSASMVGDRLAITYRPIESSLTYQDLAELALGKAVETQKGKIHVHGIVKTMRVDEYSVF